MRRVLFGAVLALLLPTVGFAQAILQPHDRAPYRQRFDLYAGDLQLLLVPQVATSFGEGPFEFRFDEPRLQALVDAAPATIYLSQREGGFHLQVLNLRARETPAAVLGPQAYRIVNGAGEAVARGTLLVLGRQPDGVDLATADPTRVLELGRAAPVRITLRTHDNYAGEVQVLNPREFELRELREELDSTGVLSLSGRLRPLRADASELRLGVDTRDGRVAEVAFAGLMVRPPVPRRVRVMGGPVFLDATGRGTARVRVIDLPAALVAQAEVASDPQGELSVLEQRTDGEGGLELLLEFVGRGIRSAGSREIREIAIRAGTLSYRGLVEVVGAPSVTSVRAEPHGRALVTAGGTPTLLRVQGHNLDSMALDCAGLGPGARCQTLSASPTELTAEVVAPALAREGEHLLPLVAAGDRRAGEATVRVHAEYPAIPVPLAGAPFVRLDCPSCRTHAEAVTVTAGAADRVRLVLDGAAVPAEHGWQRVAVTVTRIRGDNRQVVRTFGSAAAPRVVRNGMTAGALTLLDATADARHGDQFLVRVEHVAEQYAPEQRAGVAVTDAWVRSIYVDGGTMKRLTGDVVVQPVLLAWAGSSTTGSQPEGDAPVSGWEVMYPNAGFGLTWQFLNERLEPRLFSAKLQFLATNLQPGRGGGQPAVLLAGNLRVPGTDPARPLSVSAGVARMFGGEAGWRMLMGAGMDLGVARMIFGQ